MSKILRCFVNADLRSGHLGLSVLASKYGINVRELNNGEFIVFINSNKNKMKVYTAHNIVAYIKLDKGHLNLNAIQYFPTAFKAKGKIDYNEALRMAVSKSLEEKNRDLKVF